MKPEWGSRGEKIEEMRGFARAGSVVGVIEGKVLDSTGKAIAKANVVTNPSTKTVQTDASGTYKLEGDLSGSTQLRRRQQATTPTHRKFQYPLSDQ